MSAGKRLLGFGKMVVGAGGVAGLVALKVAPKVVAGAVGFQIPDAAGNVAEHSLTDKLGDFVKEGWEDLTE